MNEYVDDEDQEIPILHIDSQVEHDQLERMKAFKAARSESAWKEGLDRLRSACVSGENVMPVLIDVVEDGVTLGEACDVYRDVFGIYRDPGLI